VPGDEDIDDGQEIVGELGIVVFDCVRLVVNHEAHAMALEDGLEQIKGESTKAVAVGNHNFVDSVLEDEVQKRLQAFAFEVEARSDVRDETVAGVGVPEVLDLAFKVFLLVGRTDACVDNLRLFCRCMHVAPGTVSEEPGNVCLVVEPLPTW
jgi:hypothetical protein